MKASSQKRSSKFGTKRLGAADFLSFIHNWGHPEWVVLAAEAPLEQVCDIYGKEHSAKERFQEVPIRAARLKDNEIAPLVAAVQPKESSWVVLLRTLCLPISIADLSLARKDAQMLSGNLQARALVFFGEDTSYSMEYAFYENGKQVGAREWESQTERADNEFAKLGLYLPGCL